MVWGANNRANEEHPIIPPPAIPSLKGKVFSRVYLSLAGLGLKKTPVGGLEVPKTLQILKDCFG